MPRGYCWIVKGYVVWGLDMRFLAENAKNKLAVLCPFNFSLTISPPTRRTPTQKAIKNTTAG